VDTIAKNSGKRGRVVVTEQTKSCPFCAEEILAPAIKCKHCKSDLTAGFSVPTQKQLSLRSLPRITAGVLLGTIAIVACIYVLPLGGSSAESVHVGRTDTAESEGPMQTQHDPKARSTAGGLRAGSVSSGGPSFDCAKSRTRDELLICADPELSDEDKSLARLYRRAREFAADKGAFVHDNQLALKWRKANCSDASCLFRWYDERSNVLAHQIMESAAQGNSRPCVPLYDESVEAARERYSNILTSYVRRHRETVDEFYQHVGSNETDVMSFALAAENCGSSIVDGLQSMDNMAKSLGQ